MSPVRKDGSVAAEPQSISRAEVEHLARLSRLALTDDELDQYAAQLDSILAHVAQVSEVAADDVPPTAHPRNWPTCCASTRWCRAGTTDEALSGAPAVEQDRFAVPQILGEE